MPKREKVSIADLMDQSTTDEKEVDQAVQKIHLNSLKAHKEKTVRATIDIPAGFHKELKKLLIDESLELKTFCLLAIQEKYERLTASTDNRSN